MTLKDLFDHGAETAEFLFKAQGELIPMWLCVDDAGGMHPLIMPDMEDKDKVAATVRQFLKKNKIVQYVAMIECWMLEEKRDKVPAEVLSGEASLEHHPDRREAIHIMAESKSGEYQSGVYYILRPEHGKPTLSPFKVIGMNEAEGRFVKMFD